MGFFNKYPYTDFHELNADFILNRIKNIESQIATIKEQIEAEIFAWFQEQIKPFEEQLQELVDEVEGLKEETEETLRAYDERIDNFIIEVNNALADIRADLVASIQAVNDLTDLKIENNNIWLLNEITQNVGDLFQVQNPFTGEIVSIQSVIDYLFAFHITDSIDYDTMATRGLTYNQFEALNITYTDLTLHGNTLYT